MAPAWIEHLFDLALGVAVGWLLAVRRSRSCAVVTRKGQTSADIAAAQTASTESSAPATPDATCPVCGIPRQNWTQPLTDAASLEQALLSFRPLLQQAAADGAGSSSGDVEAHAGPIVPSTDAVAWHATPRRRSAVMRLAPPPPPESETPAHRVLRLGDAPESPINSQSPDDWEELPMPSGAVWLAPRGFRALADRTSAAVQLRKAFHRVK